MTRIGWSEPWNKGRSAGFPIMSAHRRAHYSSLLSFPTLGTNETGGLHNDREERVEGGGEFACVFPRHASSCERMIYAFLRTLGSQNATFNQAQ